MLKLRLTEAHRPARREARVAHGPTSSRTTPNACLAVPLRDADLAQLTPTSYPDQPMATMPREGSSPARDPGLNGPSTRELLAYRVAHTDLPLVVGRPVRAWMEAHPTRLAHACHPLLVANQIGWYVLNPHNVRARWRGAPDANALRITSANRDVVSSFGMGIITWRLPYLFRTPPGWQLWVKGPANVPIDGAVPLEGVVETDHAYETFTVNWKLTRKGTVSWERGAPICQLVPVQLETLQSWRTEIVHDVPADTLAAFQTWAKDREAMNSSVTGAVPYQPSRAYRRRAAFRRVAMASVRAREADADDR